MRNGIICFLGLLIFTVISCNGDGFDNDVEIPDFNFPETIMFEDSLSSYKIFNGIPSSLIPSADYELLELNSILFTDYAHKQRLVKVPAGTQMTRLSDGVIDFPDGTILVKTFYYFNDERDTTLGKRIIETRLLIKENNIWNVATYQWNDAQTNATLELNGIDTQVSWINEFGSSISTLYHIPDKNECIACHQLNSTMIPLGTKLRNLNKIVQRNGVRLNQISHLQSTGVLNSFQLSQIPSIINYKDNTNPLQERARAYLDLNCSHCHNPNAWEEPAEQDLDFRFETPLNQTGLLNERDELIELISEGEMPFIGTTILDEEGVSLITEYIESL